MIFFVKIHLKKYGFPEGFPPGAAATHRRVFCLDFFGMFRLFGECLNLFWDCLDFFEMFGLCWEIIGFFRGLVCSDFLGICLHLFGNV